MPSELTPKELELITLIAEHRLLSTGQLARLRNRDGHRIRRAVIGLEKRGLVVVAHGGVGLGRDRGRPEKVLSLTASAVELLKAQGRLAATIPVDQVTATGMRCTQHQLLLNWFRVFLVELERCCPQFSIRLLAGNSPLIQRGPDGRATRYEEACLTEPGKKTNAFVPDGVFWITHAGRQMTLLFFLEVDMGTEPIASGRSGSLDIRQKILNYQSCFRMRRYERYEQVTGTRLRGFRVLFLAHTAPRLAALCRLVRETPPSDFVWLTDQDHLFARGLHAPIWARGGRIDSPLQSMLGSEMPAPNEDQAVCPQRG